MSVACRAASVSWAVIRYLVGPGWGGSPYLDGGLGLGSDLECLGLAAWRDSMLLGAASNNQIHVLTMSSYPC